MLITQIFFTLCILIAFVGLTLWAYSAKRKNDFTQASLLPFADDAASSDERSSDKTTFTS